jgi:Spy/CpxP family protein refolding chaperone
MTILEIREVLTPEQKTKLAELMKARFERKDNRYRRN